MAVQAAATAAVADIAVEAQAAAAHTAAVVQTVVVLQAEDAAARYISLLSIFH